ncbi:hypothetical protein [Gordonia sp. (in: high G+C Gram-positive bacteria)]|uniref:hypothetical protein n=1 Tax=Gordonia sp. (in: high G+C Gram-positive bacteria) TaxID=84139 RepID=UPI003C74B535
MTTSVALIGAGAIALTPLANTAPAFAAEPESPISAGLGVLLSPLGEYTGLLQGVFTNLGP